MSFSFFLLAACGDGDDGTDLCEGVTCEQGICDLSSGQCINAADCGTSNDACLAGYECEAGACTPTVSCSEAVACDRGVCIGEVCLNPTSCNTNANCLGGFFCDDNNVCSDDLCSDTVCDNGICELGTGACVNADTCRQETQDQDCLAGFGCVQGACVNEADFCDELDCQRGVCSFEAQGCIDAPDCAGDDVQCLSGNYCDANNACQTNRCDVLGTDCPRGVCDPGQGVCIDAAVCTASNDCTDGKVCLDGACTPTAEACGAEGCTGNQECAFNEATLMAACEENAAGCLAALDCTGDRVCVAGACAAPGVCGDDALEPNNVTGQEADILSVIEELTMCTGDTDLFTFDTTTDADVFGTLNVVVEIEAADVGLGEIKVELVNPLGNVVQSGSSIVAGTQTALVDLRHLIDVVTQGKYIIRVTGDGVSTAGVRYTLRTDVVDANVLTTCGMATPIDPTVPTSGNTATGGSVELKSCGDNAGLAKENIFSLTVDVPSYVTLRALPSVDVDVSISIRSICAQDDTDFACSNGAAASDPEQIEAALAPGTYYVIVESEQASEGAYSIVTTLEPVICETADNTCADASNANVCNAKGTAFENEACANGCDMAINRCTRDAGDVCGTAIAVTDTYSGAIDWSAYISDYNPNAACVPLDGTDSDADGEDAVFAVTVPDGSALVASLDRDAGVYVSMYFVTDCLDVNTSCLVGVNDGQFSDEELFFQNDTGADIAGFLIVDRGTASTSSTATDIEIAVAPVVCTPGASRCVLNRESQTCNAAGTSFDSSTTCNFGCDDLTGECVTATNDLCGGAVELTAGVAEAGDVAILAPSHNASGCVTRTNGRDATYVLRNVPVGSLIEVDMDATFDAVLWSARECTADVLSACTERSDSGNPETLSFIASEGGDYYFIADAYFTSTSSGTFTITANVTPPQCNPGELLGCLDAATLQYCNGSGQIEDIACSGGCSNDKCATPAGDVCFDAKQLIPTLNDQTEMGTTDNGGSNSINASGTAGNCNFSSALDESDTFFTIDIPAEHALEIDFDSGSNPDLYILDSTCGIDSCKDQLTTDGDLEYYSALGETIIIVIDASFISGTATSNEWEFDYKIVPQPGRICTAGATQCSGNIAEICNVDQTSYTSYPCPNGCADGICIDDPSVSQTCATAPDVTAGFVGMINEDDYTNDVDTDPCGTDSDGGDAHFQVTLQPGEILNVEVQGGTGFWYPQAYIYTDCLDPAASCQAGSDYAKNTNVRYQATGTEVVFIGIDNESTSANDDDQASIVIEVLQPECVNGQAPTCNVAGDALTTCESGILVELACGGAGVCTNDKCETPSGDVCFDAIILDGTPAGPVPISGTFSGASHGFAVEESTVAGACRFNGTEGRDRIYEIALNQGDSVEITHDGSTDTYIAFVEDCNDPTTCLASNLLAVDDVTIEFVAQATQSYFIIVQAEFSSGSSAFTFDYEVTPASGKVCNPDSFYCLDANTVAACDENGQIRTQYNCPAGCSSGACTSVAGSATCGGAPSIVGGGYFLENLDVGSNDVSLTGSSCTGDASPGYDYFYAIDVVANEIIDLRVQTYDEFDDPIVYIFTDCLDAETSCLAGQGSGAQSQTLTYQSAIDQTVYVGLDTSSATDDSWIALEIEVRQPDCVPGVTPQACSVDTAGFDYCDETGFLQTYDCGGAGMCDPLTNRCTLPEGDVCLDPFEATPAAVATPNVVAGTLANGEDSYSLVAGNICTGSQTPANDQAYVVDLEAGQTLTASLVSTAGTPEDIAMYLTKDCDSVPNSCLVGADGQPAGSTAETLTYTAVGDETVFIIVDSFFANASGSFDLTVEVN